MGILWQPPTYSLLALFVCLCVSKRGQQLLTNFDHYLGGLRCVTSNNWLDFGGMYIYMYIYTHIDYNHFPAAVNPSYSLAVRHT